MTDSTSFSGRGYTSYGFEVRSPLALLLPRGRRALSLSCDSDARSRSQYDPGADGEIRWAINGSSTWTMRASAIGPDEAAQIDQRLVSEEPMVRPCPSLRLF